MSKWSPADMAKLDDDTEVPAEKVANASPPDQMAEAQEAYAKVIEVLGSYPPDIALTVMINGICTVIVTGFAPEAHGTLAESVKTDVDRGVEMMAAQRDKLETTNE